MLPVVAAADMAGFFVFLLADFALVDVVIAVL